MKLSIIVPVYKTEIYLKKCLDSIFDQTFSDFELIIIDDGSPDKSYLIYEQYENWGKPVKIIKKQNEGLGAAIQDGINASVGDYVGFVDSDDWIEPKMFDVLVSALESSDSDIAVCSFVKDYESFYENCKISLPEGLYEGEQVETLIKQNYIYERVLYATRWNKVFKTKLLKDNLKYFDPQVSMGEDLLRTTPAILDAKKIFVLSDHYLYHYRFNEESIVNQYKPTFMFQSKILCNLLKVILEEKNYLSEIHKVDMSLAGCFRQCVYDIIHSKTIDKKEQIATIKKELSDQEIKRCINILFDHSNRKKEKFALFLLKKNMIRTYRILVKLKRSHQ